MITDYTVYDGDLPENLLINAGKNYWRFTNKKPSRFHFAYSD